MLKVRDFKTNDLDIVIDLFFNTVNYINSKDYSAEQINVWANKDRCKGQFVRIFSENYSFILEKSDNKILGFADLSKDGLLNCFYIHKDHQGEGLGKILINQVFEKAKQSGLQVITTESSITAKGFFEHYGFECITAQTRVINSVEFVTYLMKKIF